MTISEQPIETKLHILEVKPVENVGERQIPKLSFFAKNPKGEDAWYFSFSKNLFPDIKKDVDITANVQISEREYQGNIYIDRKVTPLGGDGYTGKGGRGFQKDSASIEAQVAYKGQVELMVAKIITPDSVEGQVTIQWAMKRLGSPVVAEIERIIRRPQQERLTERKHEIDMEWLRKSLIDLQWADVVGWLQKTYNITGTKVSEMVKKLTPEQLDEFFGVVRSRLGEQGSPSEAGEA